jgi:hypothetical protein
MEEVNHPVELSDEELDLVGAGSGEHVSLHHFHAGDPHHLHPVDPHHLHAHDHHAHSPST